MPEANPEEVRSKKFDIHFPTNEQGSITFLDLLIGIEANGFSINKREEKIRVYPSKDSALCTFFVTPRKAGKLIIILNVYSTEIIAKDSGKTLISSAYIGINSHTKLGEKINAIKKLVTFSLFVFGTGPKKATSQTITATNHSSVSDVAQSHINGNVVNSEVTVASGDIVKGDKISIKDIQADKPLIIGQLNIEKLEWNDEVKKTTEKRGKSSETNWERAQATQEDVLRFLLQAHRFDPGEKVNSQEIQKRLDLTREQMHDMILSLKEKGFIKATFLGEKALLEITADGVAVLND